jgi:hypothetical protein
MKDFTLYEKTITSDFLAVVGKTFYKLRYGIQATIRADIKENLTRVRQELLNWQLLPGTNKTLFSDTTIYPPCLRRDYLERGIDIWTPDAITPVIQIINQPTIITEIIDELDV